jgi:hypothetical protein
MRRATRCLCAAAVLLAGCRNSGLDIYDTDGDGTIDLADCGPEDPTVHLQAAEHCSDGIDNDCDGLLDTQDGECGDADGDGYLPPVDCDDFDSAANPGEPEVCGDGEDNDCDGLVDDADDLCLHDDDGDGWTNVDGDCDDTDATVWPGAPEICDGLDDDCDGVVPPGEADGDADGFRLCDADCDDTSPVVHPGATEFCDGRDGDCDGEVPADELDGDADGSMGCAGDCDDADPALNGLDEDGDGVDTCGGDCDDGEPAVAPDLAEACDGLDNDCSGEPGVDEVDQDGDGVLVCGGDCDDTDPDLAQGSPETCDGLDNDCDPATEELLDGDGDGLSVCGGDCDDSSVLANPGGIEVCDGLDNDCDGQVDQDCVACDLEVPGDHASIGGAMAAAGAGDVICVQPDTWTGAIDFGGVDVTLVAPGGPAATVLDGAGSGPVVTFAAGESAAAALVGFGVTGGAAAQGAGVFVDGASPTLSRLVISGNVASLEGGGLYAIDSSLSITGSTITDNHSLADGGGLVLRADLAGAAATLQDTQVLLNVADGRAAGLLAHGVELTLDGVQLESNLAWDACGGAEAIEATVHLSEVLVHDNYGATGRAGLCLEDSITDAWRLVVSENMAPDYGSYYAGTWVLGGSLVGEQVVFRGNQTASGGGALGARETSVDLSWVVFVDNASLDFAGGAVYAFANGQLTLDNAVFAGNVALGDGGALYQPANLSTAPGFEITNAVFVDNESYTSGAVYVGGHGGTLRNVVFADNRHARTWSAAGAIVVAGSPAEAPTVEHCAFWDNTAPATSGMDDPTAQADTFEGDPGFLDTSLADPLLWDLHLGATSPLVDAGDPSLAMRDPDNTASDIGPYGGPGAGGWDLDWDGWYEWWHPGVFDPITDPAAGWDCDDRDASVFPGGGC